MGQWRNLLIEYLVDREDHEQKCTLVTARPEVADDEDRFSIMATALHGGCVGRAKQTALEQRRPPRNGGAFDDIEQMIAIPHQMRRMRHYRSKFNDVRPLGTTNAVGGSSGASSAR